MTTTVRATCAACGTVEVPVSGVRLALALGDGDRRNELLFRCPTCDATTRQRVNERGSRLLSAAGVTVVAEPAQPPVESESGNR